MGQGAILYQWDKLMAEKIYQLHFKTSLHIGTGGIYREETLPHFPSDTLFSALVVAWSRVNPTGVVDKLAPFVETPAQPPFLLSSAFPFAGPTRFFPRPLLYLETSKDIPFKRIKKANWVSETIFYQMRQGIMPIEHLDETVNFIQGNQIWLTRAEREQISAALNIVDVPDDPKTDISLWQPAVAPRVTVDRLGSGSNIFHTGRVKFSPDCGLWFAARGTDFTDLETGLTILQDEGIGGLRGTGHGAFELKQWADKNALPTPETDGYFVNLARYAPAGKDELAATMQQANTAYKLVTVKGWCSDDAGHPWRRKRVRLVIEGAYLRWPGHNPGHLVDVTPQTDKATFNQRRVYRYGLAFPVGTA